MNTDRSVFEDVLAGLKEGTEWARGKKALRVTRMAMPDPPPTFSAGEIKAIRLKIGMSQSIFSRFLSVSPKTLQAWEQGVRRPSPMSSRLLQIVDLHPNILEFETDPNGSQSSAP